MHGREETVCGDSGYTGADKRAELQHVDADFLTGDVTGRADEAGKFYRGVFDGSREGLRVPYREGAAPDPDSRIMLSDFRLGETWFAAIEAARAPR